MNIFRIENNNFNFQFDLMNVIFEFIQLFHEGYIEIDSGGEFRPCYGNMPECWQQYNSSDNNPMNSIVLLAEIANKYHEDNRKSMSEPLFFLGKYDTELILELFYDHRVDGVKDNETGLFQYHLKKDVIEGNVIHQKMIERLNKAIAAYYCQARNIYDPESIIKDATGPLNVVNILKNWLIVLIRNTSNIPYVN